MKTIRTKFVIRNCCGDLLESKVVDLPLVDYIRLEHSGYVSYELENYVLQLASRTNYQCGSCYDSAYNVRFNCAVIPARK